LPNLAAALQLQPTQQSAFDEALKQMRERMAARQAPAASQQGGGSALFGRGPGGGPSSGNNSGGGANPAMRQKMLERFNQQFAAFRATLDDKQRTQWDAGVAGLVGARRAPIYKLVDGKPQMAMVRVGVSDGSNTEVSGDIAAGDAVIVGAQRAEQKTTQ
jgi:HlyD family secretion protein